MIAVEPEDSAVLSGGQPGPHKIQGIGAGFVPDNLETSLIDEVMRIGNDTAFRTARARSEEHTSELQSLMRISYAVFCLKKKKQQQQKYDTHTKKTRAPVKHAI